MFRFMLIVYEGSLCGVFFPQDAFDYTSQIVFYFFKVPLYSLFHRRSLGSFYMNINLNDISRINQGI